MRTLCPESIILDAQVDTREEAIRTVGAVLVERGYVDVDYIAAMFEREDKGSTFVGNGVAVPCAARDAKVTVKTPAAAMLQIPGGVDWDGAPAYLVFGVADSSRTQGDLAAQIARRCADPMKVGKIRYAATAQEVIALMDADG